MTIRNKLYNLAKVLGDVQAVRKGRVVQRVKNRFIWRLLGKIGRKLQ